jgi:hypothetical protein
MGSASQPAAPREKQGLEIKMLTIYIRSNETGEVVATHTAATNAECEAWARENYDINDYSWSYCA